MYGNVSDEDLLVLISKLNRIKCVCFKDYTVRTPCNLFVDEPNRCWQANTGLIYWESSHRRHGKGNRGFEPWPRELLLEDTTASAYTTSHAIACMSHASLNIYDLFLITVLLYALAKSCRQTNRTEGGAVGHHVELPFLFDYVWSHHRNGKHFKRDQWMRRENPLSTFANTQFILTSVTQHVGWNLMKLSLTDKPNFCFQ